MNPIEHLWYQVKRKINNRERRPHNVKELKRALLEEWEKIDENLINSLIDSMARRVETLLACQGTSRTEVVPCGAVGEEVGQVEELATCEELGLHVVLQPKRLWDLHFQLSQTHIHAREGR